MDRMERLFNERFDGPEGTSIVAQAPLQFYRPRDEDIAGNPDIKPAKPVAFFTKPSLSDAELKESIRKFPKNVYMDQYKAPKIPMVASSSDFSLCKKHDGQIRDFQERCAEITRPVDFFYHQVRRLKDVDPDNVNPTEILDISINFAVLMRQRQHLGGLAAKMHETRMYNVREAAGVNFEEDPLNMCDPQTFHDHTKSVRTLQTFFKTKTGTDNCRHKSGSGNNNYPFLCFVAEKGQNFMRE